MMAAPLSLELIIVRTQGQGRPFQVTWVQDGCPRVCHTCSTPAYQAVHFLVDGFRHGWQEGEGEAARLPASHDTTRQQLLLDSVGVELFHLWLAPFWFELEPILARQQAVVLTIVANSPEVLNLPWEVLQWPDGVLLGLDERVALRRRSLGDGALPQLSGAMRVAAPLKILFMASAPDGFNQAVDRDFSQWVSWGTGCRPPVQCAVLQTATVAALQQRLQQFQPQVLYLTGPVLISGEQGFFGFVDEAGQADIRSAREMATEILLDSGVHLVILAGREPNRPPPIAAVAALCQGWVGQGVAWALAWPGLLTDPFSSDFFHVFLHNLQGGATLDQAVRRARCAIQPGRVRTGYPAWVLPVLYARSNRTLLFNTCSTAMFMQSISPPVALSPLAGLTGGFVRPDDPVYGEIPLLLPEMQAGRLQVVLLRGLAGSGKTRLASGVAQLLGQSGWVPLALAATPCQPLSTGRLLAAFATVLVQHDRPAEAEVVCNPLLGIEERLRVMVAVMRRQLACVLVLDGLDNSLDPATGHFLEAALAGFWTDLLRQPAGLSRVVLTSQIFPVVAEVTPSSTLFREVILSPGRDSTVAQLAAVRALDAATRAQVTAMATFHYPVPVAGYCAVTHNTVAQQESLLQVLEQTGLAQSYTLPGTDPLWSLHPVVRDVLDADQQPVGTDEQQTCAGEYLFAVAAGNRQDALGLSWLDLALEAVGHLLHCSTSRQHERFAGILECAGPVSDFLSRHGFLWEQERLNRALLAIREHPRPLYLTAMAVLRRNGQAEARQLLERVLTFGEALFPRENALALFDLASLEIQHNPEEAKEKLLRALAINQRVGDHSGQAVCHAHLGFWGLQQADMAVAQNHLEEALMLCRALNDQTGVARLLPWTGELLWRVGNIVAARRHFQEALQLLGTEGDRAAVEAQLYHRLAIMDLGEELFDQALTGFLRSLAIKRATNNQKGEAVTFFQLGRLAKAKGNELASLRFLGLCQRIAQALGDPDAEHALVLFHELAATALGLDQATAQVILEEVWADYGKDRGQSLIVQAFGSRTGTI
ncbi:MAG: CHAT domain-containing protein [Magnetococcales bacterium]|nr:CHAT domain-containing protein [Magnetococcales bacterium]